MEKETKEFQAESKELLNLMINSIYSNTDVFLRELISNASDAIDKAKYIVLNSNGKYSLNDKYEIWITPNKENRTITISDNGVGMNHDDLINDLGTIAKSGSKDFISKFKEAKDKKDFEIIGQFGVGFYSAFMVAKSIEVESKTFDSPAYKFVSNGEDTYSIEESSKESLGTTITLHLKDDTEEKNFSEYLSDYKIEDLVSKYSDYIRYPILMEETHNEPDKDSDGKEIEGKTHEVKEIKTLNKMIPLWKKNKKDVTKEELNEFYKNKFYDFEDPIDSIFINVEGMLSYNALVFVPAHAPYDLYQDTYERGLDLYAKGVFIKDKCKELVPEYLRFIKGVVDSSDLSLNISREMLQQNKSILKIRDNVETKVINSLKEMKNNDFEKYQKFFKNFGEFIKFGIQSSYGSKNELLQDLLIFKSLNDPEKYISLKEYVESMKEDQKYIYFASGSSIDEIKLLPELEKFKSKGINVLLLDQRIDEFTISILREYDKKEFKSISEYQDEISDEEKEKLESLTSENKRILDDLKDALKEKVSEVKLSSKLVDSPVCLVSKNGVSLNMEKVLNDMPSDQKINSDKVLEINPNHELFNKLKDITDAELIKDYGTILYNEALMLEGIEVSDKKEFTDALNKILLNK